MEKTIEDMGYLWKGNICTVYSAVAFSEDSPEMVIMEVEDEDVRNDKNTLDKPFSLCITIRINEVEKA